MWVARVGSNFDQKVTKYDKHGRYCLCGHISPCFACSSCFWHPSLNPLTLLYAAYGSKSCLYSLLVGLENLCGVWGGCMSTPVKITKSALRDPEKNSHKKALMPPPKAPNSSEMCYLAQIPPLLGLLNVGRPGWVEFRPKSNQI